MASANYYDAQPVQALPAALVITIDKVLSYVRINKTSEYETMFNQAKAALEAKDLTSLAAVNLIETFTELVLDFQETAATQGSISLLPTDSTEEVTRTPVDAAQELEEVLMTFALVVKDNQAAYKRFVEKLEADLRGKDLRLRILMYIFGAEPLDSPMKSEYFYKVVTYSVKAGILDVAVLPVLPKARTWVSEWTAVSPASKRRVCVPVIEALEASRQKTGAAFEWKKLMVSTYEDEGDDFNKEEACSCAADCLRENLAVPTEFYFDTVMGFKATQLLKNNAQHFDLFELGQAFLNGTVDDVANLLKAKPSLLEKYSLNQEQLLRKIRVIVVSSEPQRHQTVKVDDETGETLCNQTIMKLEDLARVIGLSADETEAACVSGTTHGLLGAKLDQLSKAIHVEYAMCREFKTEDWEHLRDRLQLWSRGVDRISAMLAANP